MRGQTGAGRGTTFLKSEKGTLHSRIILVINNIPVLNFMVAEYLAASDNLKTWALTPNTDEENND